MVGSGRLETPYLEDRVIRRKCEEYLARTISGEPWLSVLIKPESLPISYPARRLSKASALIFHHRSELLLPNGQFSCCAARSRDRLSRSLDAHGEQISESGSARMIDDRVDNGRDSEGSGARSIDGYPLILNSGGVIVGEKWMGAGWEKVDNFLKKLS